jgi:hypothetical protein
MFYNLKKLCQKSKRVSVKSKLIVDVSIKILNFEEI